MPIPKTIYQPYVKTRFNITVTEKYKLSSILVEFLKTVILALFSTIEDNWQSFCDSYLQLVVCLGRLLPYHVTSSGNQEVQNVECETHLSSPFPAVVVNYHHQMEVHPVNRERQWLGWASRDIIKLAKLELSLIVMSIPHIPALPQEIKKRGITIDPFDLASCHAHLHLYGSCEASFILITWKLWEEFKTQHFTNRPTARSTICWLQYILLPHHTISLVWV